MSYGRRDGVSETEAETLCVAASASRPSEKQDEQRERNLDVDYLGLTIYLERCSIFYSIH